MFLRCILWWQLWSKWIYQLQNVPQLHWPIRRGQVLLLLELLLQAHQLQLGEDGAAAAGLLQAGCAALCLRLTADAEGRLAGRGLRAPWKLWGDQGQVRVDCARRRSRWQVGGKVGRLPRDHWEEWVGTEWRGAWRRRDRASGHRNKEKYPEAQSFHKDAPLEYHIYPFSGLSQTRSHFLFLIDCL